MSDTKDTSMQTATVLRSSVQDFFHTHKISDVRTSRHTHIISVITSATVEETLHVMKKHRILSVPVEDEQVKGMYVGLVNVMDIATAAVFEPIFQTYNTDSKLEELSSSLKDQVLNDVFNMEIFDRPIKDVLGLSREPQMIMNSVDALSSVLKHFATGVHRVLVRFDHQDPHMVLITQADVIRYIAQVWPSHSEFRNVMEKSVHDLGLVSEARRPVTLSDKSTAITGFRRMILNNRVGALPVVDKDEKVIATLSVSDLRGVDKQTFHRVLFNVIEYLQYNHMFSSSASDVNMSTSDESKGLPALPAPVTALATDPLHVVIGKMATAGVHRVWIVDHKQCAIGVVALSDVMDVLSHHDDANAADVEQS